MMIELRAEEHPFATWYIHLLGNELQYIILNSENVEDIVSRGKLCRYNLGNLARDHFLNPDTLFLSKQIITFAQNLECHILVTNVASLSAKGQKFAVHILINGYQKGQST